MKKLILISIISLLVCTAYSQKQDSVVYCQLEINSSSPGFHYSVMGTKADGKYVLLESGACTTEIEAINKLGVEGWHLVCTTKSVTPPAVNEVDYIFEKVYKH